jgi:phage virion morphogenesis protein
MIKGRIEAEQLHRDVGDIVRQVDDATPLMGILAATLMDQTEENFAQQGRPKWLGIQPRPGREGGKILQDTGRLAASITPDHGPDYAQVGSNLAYAAIHQLGGKTKPHVIRAKRAKALAFGGIFRRQVNHPGSDIPARPYLPITADGRLQPEAEAALMEDAQDYLRRISGVG